MSLQFSVVCSGKQRVSADVLNSDAFDNPVRANGNWNVRYRREYGRRDSCPLKFFGYRCAATVTAASGGDQQDGVNAVRTDLLRHLGSEFLGLGHGGGNAGEGEHFGVDALDRAIGFKGARRI